MQETINTYFGLPQFMWEGIFNIIVALGAGLIIAFVTTFYLKKKDEITRVSGVILEKRINSEQEILAPRKCFPDVIHFLERPQGNCRRSMSNV